MRWLVPDWQQAWRWASVRVHALMVLLAGVYDLMPALNPQIAAMLPAPQQVQAIGAYAIVGILVRLARLKGDG